MIKEAFYHIEKVEDVTSDICLFTLCPMGQAIPFLAGQYFFLHLPSGEKAPFSMANKSLKQVEFHLRHSPNNEVALRFLDTLKTQDKIMASGPFGRCLLPSSNEKSLVFIAGGTGIAPHKALIDEALAHDFKVHLYWGISKVKDLYLNEWLESCQKHPSFTYDLVLSEPCENWTGAQGLIHDYVFEHHQNLNQCLTYASGPYAMVQALKSGFEQRDLSLENLLCDML